MKVYHGGYSAPGFDQQVAELMRDPAMLLIDTRKKPYSWRSRWCREDTIIEKTGEVIPGLARQWGERYRWAGNVLGNKNYWLEGAPIDIVNLPLGVRGLEMYLKEGHDLILFCECADQSCHRFKILKALKQRRPDVEILRMDGTPEALDTTPEQTYKCLSIRPPYAQWIALHDQFVAAGVPPKCIENREWTTRYRGPVLLHASRQFEEDALWHWSHRIDNLDTVVSMDEKQYERGAIVGIADLVDVVQDSDNPWFCGSYGWVFANARPLRAAVPYRGQLKLFDVPADVVRHLLPVMA